MKYSLSYIKKKLFDRSQTFEKDSSRRYVFTPKGTNVVIDRIFENHVVRGYIEK